MEHRLSLIYKYSLKFPPEIRLKQIKQAIVMAKPALKAAREALNTKDYEETITQCEKALSFDPESYNAYVFLGVANFSLNKELEAKKAYQNAIELDDKPLLAWQGLWNLQEKFKDVQGLHHSTEVLAYKFMTANESEKCLNFVNKYLELIRGEGSKADQMKALSLLTPSQGDLYQFLEGRIEPVQSLYMQMADLQESLDHDYYQREVNKRKSRLGARIDQVIRDVEKEIINNSPIENIYMEIINWSQDDEIRRLTETKLLYMYLKRLYASDSKEKAIWRNKVWELVQGMITLHIPEQTAWTIYLEWQDHSHVDQLNPIEIKEFCNLFSESPLSKALVAIQSSDYWMETHSPKEKESEDSASKGDEIDNENQSNGNFLPQDQVLALLTQAYQECPHSLLIAEVYTQYCVYLKEYTDVVQLSSSALDLLKKLESDTGLHYQELPYLFYLFLAIGYSHYEVPRYLLQAEELYNRVITHEPENYSALIGLADVQVENEQHEDAAQTLERVLEKNPQDPCLSQLSWCYYMMGDLDKAIELVQFCLQILQGNLKNKPALAEAYYRYGIYLTERKVGNYEEESFSAFVSSLRCEPNFASTYTQLGYYYKNVDDTSRAMKCFQKAFELEASQTDAAEELAKMFAEVEEWELVEVISKRVLSTSQNDLKRKRKFNWHHKSLGVFQLHFKNFHTAIVHFQAALRIFPKDAHCWSGLGEGYARSGRYISALKAFNRASALDPNDWYTKYFIGSIQKDMGDFEKAIETLSLVLQERPSELCILVCLAESSLRLSKYYIRHGYYQRSALASQKTIDICCMILNMDSNTYSAWKMLGDACMVYSQLGKYQVDFPVSSVSDLLLSTESMNLANNGRQIDSMIYFPDLEKNDPAYMIACGCTCFTILLSLSADNKLLLSASWYNTGVSYFTLFNFTRNKSYLGVAIDCLKQAIKLEPKNNNFWCMLGVLLSHRSAIRAAQHCFIQALQINERDADVWVNYGALCLQILDIECADTAFTRAISIDPDNSRAWLGYAYCSISTGYHEKTVQALQHAFEISGGNVRDVNYWYASTMLTLANTEQEIDVMKLWNAVYAIKRYLSEVPNDVYANFIKSSLLEHLGESNDSTETAHTLCQLLEKEYDVTESVGALEKYVDAKGQLARLCLRLNKFEESSEHASVALDLVNEEDENAKQISLGLNLTSGLAAYFLGDLEKALQHFEKSLELGESHPDVVVLVAKVLWALGSESGKQAAREQLFSVTEQFPEHVDSLVCLGAIGIADQDNSMIAAIQEALLNLNKDKTSNPETLRVVQSLLTMLTTACDPKQLQALLLQQLFIYPSAASTWSLLMQQRYSSPSVATAFARTLYTHPSQPDDLAQAYRHQSTVSQAQASVHLVPWEAENWNSLEKTIQSS
ncbi:ski complex TPR repeat subunit Ski3 [Schizosaccharomyces cryophilus OY26]|uniref:Ski complex TPR repeat subunit Ski3 n=1 Tax=Schizosaccharomyces cryophilus (strain OY26 / ATCC MYA-4695 / CBS 11777 / NBRC 106824 / NRRL Y48691) TaxID=653667 RepID=S9VY71_SCHCR|nr:ski complex TPR repeat subunit Ski3 [Schizosaccharomyces cryophilus OY26]EPY51184.1 ski complex TPR repeat subunit Ski3 [Schizosaccharomyces cryophilus OY26]